MNIHIDLYASNLCDGCPLLDRPTLWQGRPTANPTCALGYRPSWKKLEAQKTVIPTQGYVVMRPEKCVSDNGK